MKWTQERIWTLVRLWQEGKPVLEIAHTLGYRTKDAVLGKARIIGLKHGVRTYVPEEFRPPPERLPSIPELKGVENHPNFKHWMCRSPTEEAGFYGLYICAKTAQPKRHLCVKHIQALIPPHNQSFDFPTHIGESTSD